MLGRLRATAIIVLALATVGCDRIDAYGARRVRSRAIAALLQSPSGHVLLRLDARPKALLFVDASCPNSLYALDRLLGDSMAMLTTTVHYRPQVRRDPAARFENVALECARRMGVLAPYVADRLGLVASVSRPVMRSAIRSGADSARFSACLSDPVVAAMIRVHEESADSAGLHLVPALASPSWVAMGRDAAVAAFRGNRKH
jgi:hypothetical protein